MYVTSAILPLLEALQAACLCY